MSEQEQDFVVLERFFEKVSKECLEEHHPISVTNILYCLRRGYYTATIPGVMGSVGQIKVWIGRKLHETSIYPKSEMELEYTKDGVTVHGRIDEYDPEKRLLIEKKSTWYTPDKPYKHHIKQLLMYKLLLEKNGFPVERGILLYIGVDRARATAYPVDLNSVLTEEIEKEMFEKAGKLKKALKMGILPPREVGWFCQGYCSFLSMCFSDYTPPIPKEVLESIEH